MIYELPVSAEVGGVEYMIRSDYRAILDICCALSDIELDSQEKALVALEIFYPQFKDIPPQHYEEAIQKCFSFINCGNETDNHRKSHKLMDWSKIFNMLLHP